MALPQEIEEALGLIHKAWNRHPQLRLGQLLSNAAIMTHWDDADLFYIEDDQLKYGLKKFIKEVK